MIFSVFNDNARCWEYFEAPGTSADYGARGTKYRPLNGRPSGPPRGLAGAAGGGIGPIGFTPEALAMKLPPNVRRVGSGDVAHGVVAVRGHNMRPASPSRWEEDGGTINGLGGLGEDTASAVVEGIPLSKVVFAACVASVVGVIVQKILK